MADVTSDNKDGNANIRDLTNQAVISMLDHIDEEGNDLALPAYSVWLRSEMDRLSLDVSGLADLARISKPTIYNILNGSNANPQQRTRDRISAAFESLAVQQKTTVTNAPPPIQEQDPNSPVGELIDFDPFDDSALPTCTGVYVFTILRIDLYTLVKQ